MPLSKTCSNSTPFLSLFNKLPRIKFLLLFAIVSSSSVAIAQDSVDKLFNKAYYYLSVDKVKAISILSECIDLDSAHSDAFFHRGVTYFKLEKYDSAMMDFNHVHELSPDKSIIWMYKGFTHRNNGEIDQALQAFSNYITLNPTDTSAYSYVLRGKMKYELGDFDGAVADYDMAVKLQPFEEKYYYYRFIAQYDAEKYIDALKSVTKLIETNPNFYGYYFYKGNVFQGLQLYDSAIYQYNVAIIKNYQNSDSYFYRGQSYQKKGELQNALEDYNTAIVLNSSDGMYYSERGNVKYSIGNKEEACEDWNEAGALGYYEDFDLVKKVCE